MSFDELTEIVDSWNQKPVYKTLNCATNAWK